MTRTNADDREDLTVFTALSDMIYPFKKDLNECLTTPQGQTTKRSDNQKA
jgi:hypothetical protein